MENRCYKCDFYYNDICNHYAEPSTTDDDKCRWFKEKSAYDMDAYRAAVKALVEAAKSLLALTDCLLGDGMTRGTEPVEIREARQAISAVERLGE